jgi:hypothetical protein
VVIGFLTGFILGHMTENPQAEKGF